MSRRRWNRCVWGAAWLLCFAVAPMVTAEVGSQGAVELPLATYNSLIENGRPAAVPNPAPAPFALGTARVTVKVDSGGAQVTANVELRVLEDGWQLVPVLPPGTAVESARIDSAAVQLIQNVDGLGWGVDKTGAYQLRLTYRVDVDSALAGHSLALPLPKASSILLEASVVGTGLDVAVIPAAGQEISEAGGRTKIRATVPASDGVLMSWRLPSGQEYALSRARYRGRLAEGRLAEGRVTWQGDFSVELFGDETVTLPILPRSMTLSSLLVDGKEAAILVRDGWFATLVRGRGRHRVVAGFEAPIVAGDGLPGMSLSIPRVPVSSFELTLPGKKEVEITPASGVDLRTADGNTVATAHVPITDAVTFHWTEAVPESLRAEARINASLFHTAQAEEGVLYLQALVELEVARGDTSELRFALPANVQVGSVTGPAGGVADWRVDEVDSASGAGVRGAGDDRDLVVFLDRRLAGALTLDVRYDRSITAAEPFEVPLLHLRGAQRQRGMVALLVNRDLTLEPTDGEAANQAETANQATAATRVGENQLPAFVRQQLSATVAHTFKYVEQPPALRVKAMPPERQQGRFDARVDTLFSLGEVALEASATVEIDVKSGSLMELRLNLPEGAHLLSLSGPSVRQHQVIEEMEKGADERQIEVEFTQEMEGQFRLEVVYERILGEHQEIEVPTLGVAEAEVQQGRLAVEALSAVEVLPATVEQLTALDVGELPKQLILRTTNPILHAYKYVGTSHRLALAVTRHQVVEIKEAAIDRADYHTLFTRDGLAVTRARFQVRNAREQFLRVLLPEGSKVWSAFVDGRPEKPAQAAGESGEMWHLIKIIHSTRGFLVELIFETPARPVHGLGTLTGVLPRPAILVTQSRWDVFVPQGVDYRQPTGDLELVSSPAAVDRQQVMAQLEADGPGALEPLRLVVPSAGVHFAFEKLYANQGDRSARFSVPYASGLGGRFGLLAMLFGAGVMWLGLAIWARQRHFERHSQRHRLGIALAIGALLWIVILSQRFQLSVWPVIWLSLLTMVALASLRGRTLWQRWRARDEDSA